MGETERETGREGENERERVNRRIFEKEMGVIKIVYTENNNKQED